MFRLTTLPISLVLVSLAAAGCGETFVSSGGTGGMGGSGASGGSTISAGGSGGDTSTGATGGSGGTGGHMSTGGTGGTTSDCSPGLSLCGDACVDTDTDRQNCGSCGTECGSLCSAGKCDDPVYIAAGGATTCAVTQLGSVYCWGKNNLGQFGTNVPAESGKPVKVGVPAEKKFVAIALGKNPEMAHVCAFSDSFELYCWGPNDNGKLGIGMVNNGPFAPTKVNLADVTAIALGARHTVAITDGYLGVWGANEKGQLGPGNVGPLGLNSPLGIPAYFADAIGAGFLHACAAHDGALQCWGGNSQGQIGNGASSMLDGAPPTTVDVGGQVITRVKGGQEHTCALDDGGGVWCWGNGFSGQLGNGLQAMKTLPVGVAMPEGATAESIDCGGNHSGAVADGEVYLWGHNIEGQTKPGGGDAPVLTPTLVEGVSDVKMIALGFAHSCALTHGGQIYCWGNNSEGQTGNGSADGVDVPVTLVGFQGN